MKKLFICFIISMIFCTMACVKEKHNAVEGVWDLVYAGRMAADSLVLKFPGDYTGSDVKVWTKTHVFFVGRFKADTTFYDNYGGGTYKLTGNRCVETILYHANTGLVGSTINMLIDVRGDSLIQTWPVDENWEIDEGDYRVEKYVRLE